MFKNYLNVAYRNMVRYKMYSVINIMGLAIGVAFCLLTFLYIRHEWTYDTFHEHSDQIYRLYREGKGRDGELYKMHNVSINQSTILKNRIPEVVKAVRVCVGGRELEDRELRLQIGEKFYTEMPLFVDASFFEVFSFPLIQGDPKQVLAQKNSVVLTTSMAKKLFQDADPLGKELLIRSRATHKMELFTITGLAADPPQNSSIQFQILVAFEGTEPLLGWNFNKVRGYEDCDIYVLSKGQVSKEELDPKISSVLQETVPDRVRANGGFTFGLQKLTDLHLEMGFMNWTEHGTIPPTNPTYAYVLLGIALLILLIAVINYVNLAVGRSATRVLEVGIRRVVGANRGQIRKQFLGESILFAVISVTIGLVLTELTMPLFNSLTQRTFGWEQTWNLSTFVFLLGLIVVVGLLGGFYPALVASGIQPVAILKGRRVVVGPRFFGRLFVVFQFFVSICLVIGASVMFDQMKFIQNKDMGFDQEMLVSLWVDALPEMGNKRNVLKNSLQNYHRIEGIASARYSIFDKVNDIVALPGDQEIRLRRFYVDYDFIKTLKMQVVNGRDFDAKEDGLASGAMVVNETFARKMGWENPVGQTLQFEGGEAPLLRRSKGLAKVVGVVKDFHFFSLHHQVDPTAFLLNPSMNNEQDHFLIRIQPEDVVSTLAFIKEKWHEVTPHDTFRYTFLDAHFAQFYAEEARWERIVRYGAFLAIWVACLGTFGLTALAVTKRTKEIGIRKVFGAGVVDVVGLLSQEFVILVVVANVIAWPVAWWTMQLWLSAFAYRIELDVGNFVLGGILTLLVVIVTVGIQAIKAAQMNPVETLRYE